MSSGYVRLYHGTSVAPDVIFDQGLGGWAPSDRDIEAECQRHGYSLADLWSVPHVRSYLEREVQAKASFLSVTTGWRNAKNYSRHGGEWRYIVHAALAHLEEGSPNSPILSLPSGGFGYSASAPVSTCDLIAQCTPHERYVVVLDVPLQLAIDANGGSSSGLSDEPLDPIFEWITYGSDHVLPAPVPLEFVTRIDRVLAVECHACSDHRSQEPGPLRDGSCSLYTDSSA